MKPQSGITSDDDLWESDAITIPVAPPTLSPAASLVVLSQDPMLLEAITTAAAGVASVTVWPSADRIMEQLAGAHAQLLLIDPACAPAALAPFLDAIHRRFSTLQLLLVGPGIVQHQLQTQLIDGTVFRFIHKPASAQRLKLFVNAALRERPAPSEQTVAPTPPSHAKVATPRPIVAEGGSRWRFISSHWRGAALAASVLLAIAGILIWRSSRPTQPVALLPTVAKPIAPSEPTPVAPLPSDQLAPAAGENAAMAPAEKDRAAAQKEAPKPAVAEQARRPANDARSRQIDDLVQLAQSRIASGALIDPNNDSARTYVSSATQLAPQDPRVRAASLALGEAMVAEFHQQMAAGDLSAAERWLKASGAYPIAKITLTQMGAQLDAAKAAQQTHTVANNTAARAAGDSRLAPAVQEANPTPASSTPASSTAASSTAASPAMPTTPAQSSAAVEASSVQTIPEASLRRLSFTAPEYPEDAFNRRQGGTVELDFTLTPQGRVTDIKVTESTPRGTFDRAAVTAFSHNRYQPVERNGVPVSQRVHARLRFTP